MFILDCTLDCKYIQSTCNRKWTDKRLTANICYFRCFSLSISIVLCCTLFAVEKLMRISLFTLSGRSSSNNNNKKQTHTVLPPKQKSAFGCGDFDSTANCYRCPLFSRLCVCFFLSLTLSDRFFFVVCSVSFD